MVTMPETSESDRQSGGFTLIEALLSAVILAGLMILLLTMADRTFTGWGDGQRRVEQLREARASLQMIGEDLRSAVITADPSALLIRKEKCGDTLFLLVSHPHELRQPGIKGDLCAAGYFIAPDPAKSGERNLYRFHASGDEVIRAVRDRSLETLYASAAPGKANTELLARNIAGLHLSPVLPNPQGTHPEGLRVTVTALDRSAMRRLMKSGGDQPAAQSEESPPNTAGTSLSSCIMLPPARKTTRTP